jgi:hypothetical protein
VFAIQDEISQAIAEKLRTRLSGDFQAPQRHTDNVEAYSLYLKGRYHYYKFTQKSFEKTKEHYAQAIAIDPTNALAWYGMGILH